MIEMLDIHTAHPFLAQFQAGHAGPITLVNIFIAPDGKAEDVLAAWEHDAKWMMEQPGFISTQMHRNVGTDNAFTNVARWESIAALGNAVQSPEFGGFLGSYPDGTVAYPVVLCRLAVEGICEGE